MADDTLIVLVENDSESFAAGIDVTDGTNRWKIPRTKRANWSTPVTMKDPADGRTLVALQGSAGLDTIDPKSGQVVWSYTDGASTTPSSTVKGDVLYVPSNGLTALKLKGGGAFEQLWQQGNLRPGTASPVAAGDKVYVITGAGVLNCANAKSGERLWRIRLDGPFRGSPVVAGDYLFGVSERNGKAQLVDLRGDEGKVVGKFELGELVQCTPALSDGAVYVRSDSRIWKLAGS